MVQKSVFVFSGNIDHLVKRDHLDANITAVPGCQVLYFIFSVYDVSIAGFRAGVLPPDYKVGTTIILCYDHMQYGVSWTRHTHRQGK